MNHTHASRRKFLAAAAGASLLAPAVHAVAAAQGKIRVGQIGVGHAHAGKLAVYRASPDYEVVGIVEPDAGLRQQAESQAVYRDLPWLTREQLLNVPELQAVLVETRVRDSLAAAAACIAAGKHIHLDKPAGGSLPHLARILAAARERQLLVQMGYMYRYNPAIVLLRQFSHDGWLGDVFEVHAVMSKVVNPAGRKALAEYRGGIMFELGCHLLDLVVGLLGEPANVSAVGQHAAPIDDTLRDNMLAVLEYPRAIASVKSSAQEVDGGGRRHLVVCGTEATFHIQPLDDPAVRLTLARARGPYAAGTHEIALPKYTRYIDDAADMARIIRGEQPSRFSYDHDLAVQRTLLKSCAMPLDN